MRNILSLIILITVVSCQWQRDSKNDKYYHVSDTINYSDFEIIYDMGNKAEYFSSYDSSYTRRYNQDSKTIRVILSPSEKKQIFEKIKYADILSMPDTLIGKDEISLPCFSTGITITFGKFKKRIYHVGCSEIKDKNMRLRYEIISFVITDILYKKVEIKRLPESDIIYM